MKHPSVVDRRKVNKAPVYLWEMGKWEQQSTLMGVHEMTSAFLKYGLTIRLQKTVGQKQLDKPYLNIYIQSERGQEGMREMQP